MTRSPAFPVLIAWAIVTLACTSTATPEVSVGTITVATASPQSTTQGGGGGECSNEWFPSDEDATWESAGTNSLLGDYQSTSTVIESHDDGFTVRRVSSNSDVDFVLEYGCTDAGLVMLNPMDQFGTASATGPSGSAIVNTTAASGLTLPSDLHAGQTWQQYLAFEVIGPDATIHGEYTADNIARGLEVVHVPFGSFEAMRVDTEMESTIEGEPWAPCTQTIWFVKDIGVVKGESSCGGIDDFGRIGVVRLALTSEGRSKILLDVPTKDLRGRLLPVRRELGV